MDGLLIASSGPVRRRAGEDPNYHVPSSRWYAAIDPEECFATVEDAEAAGYRAPLT
jgi:hypothetical protein